MVSVDWFVPMMAAQSFVSAQGTIVLFSGRALWLYLVRKQDFIFVRNEMVQVVDSLDDSLVERMLLEAEGLFADGSEFENLSEEEDFFEDFPEEYDEGLGEGLG